MKVFHISNKTLFTLNLDSQLGPGSEAEPDLGYALGIGAGLTRAQQGQVFCALQVIIFFHLTFIYH